MTDRDRLREMMQSLTTEGARLALEVLMEEHPEAVTETDFRQSIFLARYLECGGNVARALRASGVSHGLLQKWKQDAEFMAKWAFSNAEVVEEVRQAGIKMALTDPGQNRFFLQAYDPETFDFKLRAQKLAQKGQLDQLEREAQLLSDERWSKAVADDPAQEFVKGDVVKH